MRILITGGTGTVGEILANYFYDKSADITVLSRNENKQFYMRQKYPDIKYVIGDIQNPIRLSARYDLIINCAALKHVSTGYDNGVEMYKTNIVGMQNVIDFGSICKCKVIQISTDKAVNPSNLYGATKMIAEELCYSANRKDEARCVVLRFGNVFGSSGSVVELFTKQTGYVFNISSPIAERFFVTPKEIIRLVNQAIEYDGDELIIGSYDTIRIIDLVHAINEHAKINVVGMSDGEKLKEEMGCKYKSRILTIPEIKKLLEAYKTCPLSF